MLGMEGEMPEKISKGEIVGLSLDIGMWGCCRHRWLGIQ